VVQKMLLSTEVRPSENGNYLADMTPSLDATDARNRCSIVSERVQDALPNDVASYEASFCLRAIVLPSVSLAKILRLWSLCILKE